MWTEKVDLHSHSHHSDGLWSPREMAQRACDSGVEVWSLTDHDTIAGWDEAEEACNEIGIRFIPGVEITCGVEINSESNKSSSWHLLAYFPEGASDEFQSWISIVKDSRVPRMLSMLSALKDLGIQISIEDVEKYAEGTITRPHLARAMIEKGVVNSIQEAFDKWIGDDCPAFRERPLPSIEEAVKIVKKSGGITSLAHPKHYGITTQELVKRVKELGIDCLEAVHNSHPDSYRWELMNQGFPISVGSDSHGTDYRPSPGKMPASINHLHSHFRP